MDIKFIVEDSLKYPISDWKKILILGIITVGSAIAGIANNVLGITDLAFLGRLIIIGFLIGFLAVGYLFKIMKTSFAGSAELPKFNSLPDMYMDGIKFAIVYIVYIMPVIFIAPLEVVYGGIWNLFEVLYTIMIMPVFLMALTNIANHNRFGAAFEFREIFDEIGDLGWLNITKWYISTGIPFLVIFIIGSIVTMIATLISPIGMVLFFLIVTPYLGVYFYRSAGLFYRSVEITNHVESGAENPKDTVYNQEKCNENLNESIEEKRRFSGLQKTINRILSVVFVLVIMSSAICLIVFSFMGI